MSQNLIQAAGGQPQKQTKFVSLFTSRFMAGMYTNRNLLRGPLSFLYSDFYHAGATDALCDGLNSELSIRQTMIRRPGNPKWSTQTTAAAIDDFYSFHHSDGTIQVIADSTTDVEVVTPTTNSSVFTKTTGAGQGYFQGINQWLYIADGVDLVKYIPSTTNPQTGASIWNWGGVAPTVAPIIGTPLLTSAGGAGVAWQALSTYTTMGFVTDGAGNIHQLVGINAAGTNSNPYYGTSGTGAPAFSTTINGTVVDNSVTWTCEGPIVAWSSGTLYNHAGATIANSQSCIIYDPTSNACYIQINGGSGNARSGFTKPPFTATLGWKYEEPACNGSGVHCVWFFLGNIGANKTPALWQTGHTYPALGSVTNNDNVSGIVTPVTVQAAGIGTTNSQTVYWQTSAGGTSAASATTPQWATSTGSPTTFDGDLVWNFLGSGTRQNNHTYFAWGPGVAQFSVIQVAGIYYVCQSSTGPSGAAPPTFNTVYGQTTQDGVTVGTTFTGVTWVCVGQSLTWATATIWYLPSGGFVPPQTSQTYGGAVIYDSNGNIQYVIESGKSGGAAPSWQIPSSGTDTTDGSITWHTVAPFASAGFTWTTGYGYVYSYFARTSTDIDVTQSPPLQIDGTNSPNIIGPLGVPFGCGDGSVTTASPLAQLVGGSTVNAVIPITLTGSTDPQFDTIRVYRSADGFSASGPYLFLTDVNMPPLVGNQPGTVTIYDFMPDTPTNTLPGLDPLITAPVDHVNDPPPGQYGSLIFTPASAATPTVALAGTAMIGSTYHQGRMWGFIGTSVYASTGPDVGNGNGNGFTAWNPVNIFPFDSPVVKLLATPTALLVFTTTDVFLIGGGPDITTYYSQQLAGGIGLGSPNAVVLMLGLPYLFTNDRQFVTVDPSGGFTRIGHPIGDKLVSYTPASVYVTYHSYGDAEHALYISNGSTEWYRCDPNPTPDSQMTGPVWSPKCTISGGFKALRSIDVGSGTKQLLVGPAAAGYILNRDSTFTTFLDNGSAYSSYFTMGNIVLAHPGQMAQCDFIEMDFMKLGTQPTVSVLFDELSATSGAAFESISNTIISDPPKKYGQTGTPNTMWMNRYNFGQTTPGNGGDQTPVPAWCKSMQIKVDFGSTDTVENELLTFSIFGALYQEK